MKAADAVARDRLAPVGPVPRRGVGVVEGVLRLGAGDAGEGQRRLDGRCASRGRDRRPRPQRDRRSSGRTCRSRCRRQSRWAHRAAPAPIAMLRQEPPTAGVMRLAARPPSVTAGNRSAHLRSSAASVQTPQLAGASPGARFIASRLSRSRPRSMLCTPRFLRWKSASSGLVGSLNRPSADMPAIAALIELCGAAGDRAQHRSAQQHGLLRLRQRHRVARRVGHDLAHQRAAAGAAADHDGLAAGAMGLQRVDHVGEAVGQPAQAGDEQPLQRRQRRCRDRARRSPRASRDRHRASGCRGIQAAHAHCAPAARRRRRRRSRARMRFSRYSMTSMPALFAAA